MYAYRSLGYENRAIADNDFRNDLIDAGEVGAGHRVTAFYEVVPEGGTVPVAESAPTQLDGALYDGPREVPAGDLVLVKVRYKHVDAVEADRQSLSPGQIAPADLDMQWALAIAALADILKKNPYTDPNHLDIIGKSRTPRLPTMPIAANFCSYSPRRDPGSLPAAADRALRAKARPDAATGPARGVQSLHPFVLIAYGVSRSPLADWMGVRRDLSHPDQRG